MSPYYPQPYPANVVCRYTLLARPSERVQIVFADFDLSYPQGNPNDPYRYPRTALLSIVIPQGNPNDPYRYPRTALLSIVIPQGNPQRPLQVPKNSAVVNCHRALPGLAKTVLVTSLPKNSMLHDDVFVCSNADNTQLVTK